MIGQQHLFQSIYRAITAEEKQGFINTGAAGSFSGYLADTIPELDGKFAPEMIENLKAIALTYGESSPLKRRGLMVQIKEMLSIVTSPPTKEAVSQGVVSISNRVAPKEKLAKPVPIDDHALQYVKGVGPQRAIQLGNLGIKSLEDRSEERRVG